MHMHTHGHVSKDACAHAHAHTQSIIERQSVYMHDVKIRSIINIHCNRKSAFGIERVHLGALLDRSLQLFD